VNELESAIQTACRAARYDEALTLGLSGYGPELLGYLMALARNASDADDLFGTVSERLWRSLPRFRWDSSFRTYAYTIARNTWRKHVRSPRQRAAREPLSSPQVAAALARVRTQTATFLRTETRDRIAALRAELSADDQTLLILRVNRQMAWREIAQVMADDEPEDPAALARRAAALRKRFERLKVLLRERASQRAN
jgi:RNA polymerase sigma-70 factor, ECF subfamily